ncbi:gamma-glutamyltransferase family protein [Nesterenkonia ebinurensis]|uniref:gamma-glutamyltransferase family protein n=1 Tax=Nesterenkonia ebinurensis TaxID=2608252 RepID=UPI00295F3DB7|nr:gamma-glutamyltransferase [Nesterenkonia ebinurensis]
MAASTHWLASAAAQAVLERGGNAFDAGVAGGFVLQVVEPHLNGPAGDMTGIIFVSSGSAETKVLMGQGTAPRLASVEYFQSLRLTRVPGADDLAAVPGATDAWLVLLRDYGIWHLRDILQYAIDYARNVFNLLSKINSIIHSVRELFLRNWPTSADLWLVEGAAPKAGEVISNVAFTEVLEHLIFVGKNGTSRVDEIESARLEWKSGSVAKRIVDFGSTPHMHPDGNKYSAVIGEDDLAEFSAGFEEPCVSSFRGYTIAKTGPWGQGPALLQALKILEGYDDAELDPSKAGGVHLVLEAFKLAFADCDTYYGNGDCRLEYLLSEKYEQERRGLIGEQASLEFRPGNVPGARKVLPELREADEDSGGSAITGELTVSSHGDARGDTCHIDVVDRWGNMISATPSGGWLQSSPAIPGLGFGVGTRLQMTWLDRHHSSALTPGERPRTTLTPTMVLKDGEPIMALGSPGGDQQDQWQLLFLLRVLVGGQDLQDAIDAPAFHTTSMPSSFWPRTWAPGGAVVEDRVGEDFIQELASRGHLISRAGDWSLGCLSCVTRDPASGVDACSGESKRFPGVCSWTMMSEMGELADRE